MTFRSSSRFEGFTLQLINHFEICLKNNKNDNAHQEFTEKEDEFAIKFRAKTQLIQHG